MLILQPPASCGVGGGGEATCGASIDEGMTRQALFHKAAGIGLDNYLLESQFQRWPCIRITWIASPSQKNNRNTTAWDPSFPKTN